ncbi:hypothetical protein KK083_09330 [Fulvivirgaceae bacterium PWU4]|uniref:Secreted repeat protein with Y-X4-D motif n=1 Tax=Chryseosolibacter histidini TaxID=2782349 RepID=A0AAP2GNN6_9BACT|nr:hypothetical protein [Chryseosolibacter histidini]MBT1697075.1 hypothetical protein [Chryseosolibacter histidini]
MKFMHFSTSSVRSLFAVFGAVLLAFSFNRCSDDDSVNPGVVSISTHATLGEILVDGNGKTLYVFTKDVGGQSQCADNCLAAWPVYYAADLKPQAGIDLADFATITRNDGRMQTTYKGWPLYYYVGDKAKGDATGEALDNEWFVAKTNYSIMLVSHATYGNVLTDNQGRILYFFARDTKGTSNCTGGCLTRWPFFKTDQIVIPSGGLLNAADFGSIGDGATKQTTYKGRPLYYFSPDNNGSIEAAGQTGGENFGTIWFVAKPDYSLMVANAQLVGLDGKNYTSAYVEGTGVTRYFTDAAGRTLYLFTNDKKSTNTFTNSTFSNDANWPIFHTQITRLPSGMSASDFGTITVFGRSQLTYKGWPLYYFGQDAAKGDTKGVSVGGPGKWPVITTATAEAPL